MKKPELKGGVDWSDADYMAYWKSQCIINEQGCWLYQGYCHPGGYGEVGYRGKKGRLHRLAYEIHHGYKPLPGWDVCHTCDNRTCMNPLHLFAGHRMLNMQDMKAKGRCSKQKIKNCPKGHPYEGDNLMIDSRGWRHCRICQNLSHKRSYQRLNYRARRQAKREAARLSANVGPVSTQGTEP